MNGAPNLWWVLDAFVEVHAEEAALDDHAEDVFEREVGLLDVHGDFGRNGDEVIAELAHSAAARACEADGGDVLFASLFEGAENVGRVAGGGDAEKDVSGLAESFDLSREDAVEAIIIAARCKDRAVGRESDGAQRG